MRFEFVRDGRTMAVGHAKGAFVGAEGIVNTTETHPALGIHEKSPAIPSPIE
jgi:hypothetical protein